MHGTKFSKISRKVRLGCAALPENLIRDRISRSRLFWVSGDEYAGGATDPAGGKGPVMPQIDPRRGSGPGQGTIEMAAQRSGTSISAGIVWLKSKYSLEGRFEPITSNLMTGRRTPSSFTGLTSVNLPRSTFFLPLTPTSMTVIPPPSTSRSQWSFVNFNIFMRPCGFSAKATGVMNSKSALPVSSSWLSIWNLQA